MVSGLGRGRDHARDDGQGRPPARDPRAGEAAGGSDSAVLLLLQSLPSLPVSSITTAAARIGRTFKATSDGVDRVQVVGVVRQVTLGRRNRAFEAVGLLEAFTGFERALANPDATTAISPPLRPVPRKPLPG